MLLLKSLRTPGQQKHYRGNAIVEYAVIGVLGVGVVIVGLQAMSGNLNGMFSLFQAGMTSKSQTAEVAATAQAAQAAGHSAAPSRQDVVSPVPASIPPPALPATSTSTSAAGTTGLACTSTGQCIQTSMTNYSPTQTAGANGISLVDYYANVIQQIANLAHADSNVNPDFAAMIDDIAQDGHGVADDERSVLTFTNSADGGFDFSIQSRYKTTLDRAMSYLQSHPNELSPEMSQLLVMASNNITQQQVDFLNGAGTSSVSSATINQKFTDAGGTQGSTYVDQQAIIVCGTGGQACATQ